MQSIGNGSFQWSSSDDEDTHEVPSEAGTILDCKGILRRLWMTKVVTVHSDDGVPVAEGICYSINSDLVLDCNGPMRDSHVAVQISKSLYTDHVLNDWRYSLRAWPITHVFYSGASLRDHEVWYNYNCRIALVLERQSSASRP